MKSIQIFKILLTIVLVLFISSFVSNCKKKDCNGPCELIARCATKIGAAQKEMQILNLGCKDACAKYRDPVTTCYTKAVNKPNECDVMTKCMYRVYKSGNY